jgi:hypothetical protein
MILHYLQMIANKLLIPPDEHSLIPLHETRNNTYEGSEFLDDALRIEDQSVVYFELS